MSAEMSSPDRGGGEDSRSAKELVVLLSNLTPEQIRDVTDTVKLCIQSGASADNSVTNSAIRIDNGSLGVQIDTPKFTAPRATSSSPHGERDIDLGAMNLSATPGNTGSALMAPRSISLSPWGELEGTFEGHPAPHLTFDTICGNQRNHKQCGHEKVGAFHQSAFKLELRIVPRRFVVLATFNYFNRGNDISQSSW